MIILGFELVNEEKLDRVVNGSIGKEGRLENGVGKDVADEVKIAAYDRLGGLIRKNGNKVKTGSFWDFANNCQRKEFDVFYEFRDINGDLVEVPEGEEAPIEVKATRIKKVKRGYKNVNPDKVKDVKDF